MKLIYKTALPCLTLFSTAVFSLEYPLGQPVIKNGMEIQGVYLKPIIMDTEKGKHMSHLPENKADIHLEADIHAVEENPNGFAEGDWMPYLSVNYTITKLGQKTQTQSGTFMPMVAADGPHYGENIKLNGYGKYRVTYEIFPPSYNKQVTFGRHIDKETGVAPWFKPFKVSWEFNYAGLGPNSGY